MNVSTNNQTSKSGDSANWPDGWYIFNNGKILGPFTASQTFATNETFSTEGKPLLVSRKGFTQWYALKDLAEIFKITEGLGRKVANEQILAKQHAAATALKASASQVSSPPSSVAPESSPLVSAPTTGEYGNRIVKKHVGPKSQYPVKLDSMGAYTAPISAQESSPLSDKKTLSNQDSPRATPVHKTGENARKISAKSSEPSKKFLLQEYFFLRGRLRLGKLRNPWVSALFSFPMSLGLLWPIWMSQMLKEIYYHAANKTTYPRSIVVNSMIPGLHFYAIYRLAGLLCEMEKQNRYKSVNPNLAVVFGLFPPLAMAYLQDAANRHWMLHARHSGVKSPVPTKPQEPQLSQQPVISGTPEGRPAVV